MRFAKYFDKDLYSKWHRLWDGDHDMEEDEDYSIVTNFKGKTK